MIWLSGHNKKYLHKPVCKSDNKIPKLNIMCIMFINIIRSSITVKSGEQPKFLIRVHGKYKLYVTWTRYNVKNKNISNVVILSAPALNFLNVCTSISKLTEVQCYCVHQYSTYLITWSRLINTKKKLCP